MPKKPKPFFKQVEEENIVEDIDDLDNGAIRDIFMDQGIIKQKSKEK